MTRLIVPPFPAASRPSKTITIRVPVALTHSCSTTSSVCSRNSSASYAALLIFFGFFALAMTRHYRFALAAPRPDSATRVSSLVAWRGLSRPLE